jgi:hypothetical protein
MRIIDKYFKTDKGLPGQPLIPSHVFQACAMGPPKLSGMAVPGSTCFMVPWVASNLAMLSCKANNSLLACSGVRMMRDLTSALGIPGTRMGDDRKIRVNTLSYIFLKLNIDLIFSLFFF